MSSSLATNSVLIKIKYVYKKGNNLFDCPYNDNFKDKISEKELQATLKEMTNSFVVSSEANYKRGVLPCIALACLVIISCISFFVWENFVAGGLLFLPTFAVCFVLIYITKPPASKEVKRKMKVVMDQQNRKFLDKGLMWEFKYIDKNNIKNMKEIIKEGEDIIPPSHASLWMPEIHVRIDLDRGESNNTPDWGVSYTSSGVPIYYNENTKETSWVKPDVLKSPPSEIGQQNSAEDTPLIKK